MCLVADWATKPSAAAAASGKKKDDKPPKDRGLEKRMTRVKYLQEKYGQRWLSKTSSGRY